MQSLRGLDTGWTVRGSNPGGGVFFRACPDLPWGPSSHIYNSNRVSPGSEAAGRGVEPPLLSKAKVKGVESYTCFLRHVRPYSAGTNSRSTKRFELGKTELCRYRLGDPRFYSLQQHDAYSSSGAYLASYPKATDGTFPWSKAAGARGRTRPSI